MSINIAKDNEISIIQKKVGQNWMLGENQLIIPKLVQTWTSPCIGTK